MTARCVPADEKAPGRAAPGRSHPLRGGGGMRVEKKTSPRDGLVRYGVIARRAAPAAGASAYWPKKIESRAFDDAVAAGAPAWTTGAGCAP